MEDCLCDASDVDSSLYSHLKWQNIIECTNSNVKTIIRDFLAAWEVEKILK